MVRIERCPVCGGGDLVPFAASPRRDQLHFAQARCAGCDLLIAQPQASAAEMDVYYRDRYYQERWSDAPGLWDDNCAAHRRYTLPAIEKLCGHRFPPSRVLEIGCGYGAMLGTLAADGHTVVGVELSYRAAAFARSRGIPVVVARFPDVPLFHSRFDVVMSRHVIEHLPDPRAFVSALVKYARPGGFVVIETEDAAITQYTWDRVRARVRRRVPPFRSSMDHTFVFRSSHLVRLLTDAGCDRVATASFTEVPARESVHWRIYKSVFRSLDCLLGHGEFLMAIGRRLGPTSDHDRCAS